MKDEIIEALRFPRALAKGNIELDDCAHGGHFNHQDAGCQVCANGPECEWLHSHDEFVALETKAETELTAALEFALGYVEAQISFRGHKRNHCQCDACGWLRGAQRLYDNLLAEAWSAQTRSRLNS